MTSDRITIRNPDGFDEGAIEICKAAVAPFGGRLSVRPAGEDLTTLHFSVPLSAKHKAMAALQRCMGSKKTPDGATLHGWLQELQAGSEDIACERVAVAFTVPPGKVAIWFGSMFGTEDDLDAASLFSHGAMTAINKHRQQRAGHPPIGEPSNEPIDLPPDLPPVEERVTPILRRVQRQPAATDAGPPELPDQ